MVIISFQIYVYNIFMRYNHYTTKFSFIYRNFEKSIRLFHDIPERFLCKRNKSFTRVTFFGFSLLPTAKKIAFPALP